MSKPSKVHMGAAKHLLRYLAGTTGFKIEYKKGGFKLTAFLDANWGNNPDNGKTTSCYLIMMSRASVGFKTGIQSLKVMPTMEADLVAAALTTKEAVFCSNMMAELDFGGDFGYVSLHIDNTATIHVVGNRTCSARRKHIALRFFYIREQVKDVNISIHYSHGISARRHRHEAPEQTSSPISTGQDEELRGITSNDLMKRLLLRNLQTTSSLCTCYVFVCMRFFLSFV